MALQKPEEISVEQILMLADQLPSDQQEELCYKLNRKVRGITIEGPLNPSSNENLDELGRCALEALRLTGVTVEQLQAEAVKIREENFAKDYPDLANAS